MRQWLKFVAMIFVAVAVAAAGAYWLLAPRVLKIAVGPLGGQDIRIVVAFLQSLQREKAAVRLKLVLTDSPNASSEQLESGKVDLAVVRSDIALPEKAATVAIIRREAIYFVTRPGSKIEKIGDLKGKAIGIITPRPANERILIGILGHYNIAEADVRIVRGTQPEITQAMQDGKLDAFFAVAPVSDRMSRSAFLAFPKADNEEPGFLPILEAEAIVEQFPAYDTVELVRGVFGGDPPMPEEETTTLATTHRLVARRTLDETVVSELTRLLFALRLSVAAEAPAAHQIELPSSEDRGARLPVHAGTIAYIEGETKTFFERYGDWIYIGIMGVSLLGSVAAALISRGVPSRNAPHPVTDDELRRVVQLIDRLRQPADQEAFLRLQSEARAVHQMVLHSVAEAAQDADRIATIRFLIDELRAALADAEAHRPVAPAAVAAPLQS